MEEYIFSIDECGTKELQDTTQNLYTLCGVLCRKSDRQQISVAIDDLKNRYFHTHSIEIKSYWMRTPKEREKRYLKPYNLSQAQFDEFSTELFALVRSSPIRLVASTVNKAELKKSYRNPYNPNAIAYELLLQRLGNICHDEDITLQIVIDEMKDGKTQAGNKWKDLLVRQHKTLIKNNGSDLTKGWDKPMNYKCIDTALTFVDSDTNNQIQIADICAYNIRRQCEKYWNKQAFEGTFYWGYEQIRPIVHTHPNKKHEINGYGIIPFPTRKSVPLRVQ